MKLMNQKNAKFVKVFTVLFTIAVMTSLCAVTAFATGGGATGSEAAYQSTIEFFITWIRRIGMMVAFVGAIMFALSIKSDETRDQLPALLTMVSGFMIQAAISNLGIFELATTNAETIFQNILLFIGRWPRRVGAAGMLVGAVMFGFSVKDNNAVGKVAALKTFAAGAIVVSVSGILHTFV